MPLHHAWVMHACCDHAYAPLSVRRMQMAPPGSLGHPPCSYPASCCQWQWQTGLLSGVRGRSSRADTGKLEVNGAVVSMPSGWAWCRVSIDWKYSSAAVPPGVMTDMPFQLDAPGIYKVIQS